MHDRVVIDSKKIEAVIFDLDGTIVDNMPYQIKAWIAFASKYNHSLTEEIFKKKYSGLRSDAILTDLFQKELSLEEIESYKKERGTMYKEIFEEYIKEVDGLTDLLNKLSQKNIKLALATTASKGNRDFALDKLNLRDYFDVILGGEHVVKGKPDPEIYKLAVSQLGISPEKCIAFEDSPAGIEAATGAGVKIIAVLTSHPKHELPEVFGAINNFNEIELQ